MNFYLAYKQNKFKDIFIFYIKLASVRVLVLLAPSATAVVVVVADHSIQVSNVNAVLLVIMITRDVLRVRATDKVH